MTRFSAGGWRIAAVMLSRPALLIIGVLLVLPYFLIAHITDAVPPTSTYQGWVAVFVPFENLVDDQVRLDIESDTPGAPGRAPQVSITVSVCGSKPFVGMLLLGGDARVTHFTRILPPGYTVPRELRPIEMLHDDSSGDDVALPSTGTIRFRLNSIMRCVTAGGNALFAGTAITFRGELRAPVKHVVSLFGLVGPRQSQTWPMVGGIPWISAHDVGAFRFPGVDGEWVRPVHLGVTVGVGSLTSRAQVESSRPSLASSSELHWDAVVPIQPSARLVNVDSEARWEDWLTAAAIFLGVGGAILATLLLDLGVAVRSRPRHVSAVDQVGSHTNKVDQPTVKLPRAAPEPPSRARRSHSRSTEPLWLGICLSILLALRALSHRARRGR